MYKVLLTGHSGFLGRKVLEDLLEFNDQIFCLLGPSGKKVKTRFDTNKIRYCDENLLRDRNFKENFGSLVQFCSTGIDSLTVMKYMDGVPKYGYYGAMYHNESPDKIKKLYADTGGQLHCLGEDEYKTAYTQSVKGLRTPTSVVDLEERSAAEVRGICQWSIVRETGLVPFDGFSFTGRLGV